MPTYRGISGEKVAKILCNEFCFVISGRSGSHVRLVRRTADGKVGTVVPMHPELKIGTLKGILRLGRIDFEEFARHL